MAGLRHPSRRPILSSAAATVAPVFPAEKNASASPSRTILARHGDAGVGIGPERRRAAPRPSRRPRPKARSETFAGGSAPNLGLYRFRLPDEDELVLRQPSGGRDGAGDDLARGVVSAEGVYRDAHWRARRELG